MKKKGKNVSALFVNVEYFVSSISKTIEKNEPRFDPWSPTKNASSQLLKVESKGYFMKLHENLWKVFLINLTMNFYSIHI